MLQKKKETNNHIIKLKEFNWKLKDIGEKLRGLESNYKIEGCR